MNALVKVTRVFRDPEISSDNILVISKVRWPTKWNKFKQKHSNNEDVYKLYLLQDDSIKLLYLNKVQDYLTNTLPKGDVNEKWESTKMCI